MATQSVIGTLRVNIVFVIFSQLIFSDCFGQGQFENSCEPPDAVEHAELMRKFVQRESFSHGEFVEYRCSPGAVFRGSSLRRTCENGNWSEALLNCQVMACPYIPDPKNGRKLNDNRFPGQVVAFECLPGYIMRGSKELLCRVDWEWRPSEPPVCEPVMCPALYGIRNGRLFQETNGINNDYGSVVEYTCNVFYVLKGNKYRVCGQDGRWSGETPECVEPFCPDYEERLYNGLIVYEHDRRVIDTFALFRCNSDSDLFPSWKTYAECLPSEKWSEDVLPQCLRKAEINFKSKTKYYLMENGRQKNIKKSDPPLQHGTKIKVRCKNEGSYELYWESYLNKPDFVSTNNNGSWEPYIPYCTEARCDIINIVNDENTMVWYENGTEVQDGFIEHNVKVFVNCSEMYEMTARRNRRSFSDKCVKGQIGLKTCKPKRCSAKSLPQERTIYGSFGEISNDYYDHTEKVILSCNPNTEYELFDKETGQYLKNFLIRCDFGQWTPVNIPVCIEKHCELRVTGGLYVRETYPGVHEYTGTVNISSGTTVLTDCKEGYQMFYDQRKVYDKQVENVCRKGDWTKNILCKPKPCRLPKIPFGKYLNLDWNLEVAEHGTKIDIGCSAGYDMILGETVIQSFSSECKYGEWYKKEFPKCKPRGCTLSIHNGTWYKIENNLVEESTKVDHGKKVEVGCEYDYEMVDEKKHIYPFDDKTTNCYLGEWRNSLFCRKRKCSLENKPDGWIIKAQNQMFVSSGEKVFAECGKEYENQNVTLTCNRSELEPSWPRCVERGCDIRKDGNAVYSTNDDKVAAGQKVNISCTGGYELHHKKSNKFSKKDQEVMDCRKGELNNFHTCKERRCSPPEKETNLVLMKSNYRIHKGFTRSGLRRYISCKVGYTLSSDKRETVCERGVWNPNLPECIKSIPEIITTTDALKTTPTASLTTEGKHPTVAEEIEETENKTSASHEEDNEKINNESVDNEIDSDEKDLNGSINSSSRPTTVSSSSNLSEITPATVEKIKPVTVTESISSSILKSTTVNKGCWTPNDFSISLISLQFEDGTEVDSNILVEEGTVLLISCLMDYDYLNSTIICGRDGTWNLTNEICADPDVVLLPECPKLLNGQIVKVDNGLNVLQCNDGYTLNLPSCKTTRCVDNEFTCGEASCIPGGCEIPGNLDPIMRINFGTLVLSSRSTVKHGDSIKLLCAESYVPTAGQLQCQAGKFIPEAKDKAFHKCEKARCKECYHGTCVNHDKCRCETGYTGEHCNTAICPKECTDNGGYCTAPDICTCPKGKEGTYCSKPMCKVPDANVYVNPKQDWYSVNFELKAYCDSRHTLIGSPSITCQESGSWSGSLYCEPIQDPVMYRFDIYTGNSWNTAGTDANVQITIIGEKDRVVFKVDKDLDSHWEKNRLFENNMRDRFLMKSYTDIGKVTEIKLRHDGVGKFDNWYVKRVTLYVNNTDEFYLFEVYRWIYENKPESIKSQSGCKFDVIQGYPEGIVVKNEIITTALWECNLNCMDNADCVGTYHTGKHCTMFYDKKRRIIETNDGKKSSIKMCDFHMNT